MGIGGELLGENMMADYTRTHADDLIDESRLAAAIEAQEYNLVAVLKPSITIDGNMWCVLHGENLQDGVAGFGPTPYLAILDFNKAFHRPLPDRTLAHQRHHIRAHGAGRDLND
jgi:hypothetical protein